MHTAGTHRAQLRPRSLGMGYEVVGPLRFELRMLANQASVMRVSLRAGMVGRAGIEPAVAGLKGPFITFDDCAPWHRGPGSNWRSRD